MAAFVDRALASGEDVRARIIRDGDLPLYVSVKHNHGDAAALARLAERLLARIPDGWTPHLNDNNMALIPKGISKKAAAAHLLETYLKPDARCPIVTLGDSLSDLPFMTLGHVAGFSGTSQIAQALAAVAAADPVSPAGGR
jgi:hydroxymethylpyrimidine pyrophosphatase-like HAD family hydrolase